MNENQIPMYFAEWNKCRQALRTLGYSPKEADAKRKQIHTSVGAAKYGKPKSAKFLTNAEIDRVLMSFRAFARPGDLMGQLDLVNQPIVRALHAAAEILDKIEIDPDPETRERYLDGVARRACKRPLLDTTDDDLVTILGALTHTWQHRAGVDHTHRPKPKKALPVSDDNCPF